MTGPHATEARRLDLSDPDTLRRLRDLQRASYAVEAELIGFDGIPALHESLEELRDCGESFLGLDDETGLAGAVSWVRLQDRTLDICRLMVHPRAHRRGIATALLDALDRAEPAWRAVVSTGTANHPALGLYKRRGFTPAGTRLIAPGTSLALLERRSMPPGDPPPSKPRRGAAAQRALPVSRDITRTASGPPGPDSAALARAIQMQRCRWPREPTCHTSTDRHASSMHDPARLPAHDPVISSPGQWPPGSAPSRSAGAAERTRTERSFGTTPTTTTAG
jgi:ribosomal protein S18 acetylase RimI-like enzyme